MLMQIISQFRRKPIPAVSVILFSVVIAFALGGLQRSNDAERESYEAAYRSIPISFAVTDFRGNPVKVQSWIAELFTGKSALDPLLDEYITQLRMENSSYIDGEYSEYMLVGITSAVTAPSLDPACGGQVTWFEGYDESVFESDSAGDMMCVLPVTLYETMEPGTTEIKLEFMEPEWDSITGHPSIFKTFTIVGTYASVEPEFSIFCPYDVVRRLNLQLTGSFSYHGTVSGILKDNYRLDEFRTAAANWFGEVNPEGKETPWGKWGYEYYPYAIDIDDSLLQHVTRNYEISIFINEMSLLLILSFCTAAGFMIGFLLIRSRKREIGLMRTLGGSNFRIYLGFAIEQLFCVTAGIALGGALMAFNAPKQLALFVLVYFLGLSAALIVFLNKNLLSGLKEDE